MNSSGSGGGQTPPFRMCMRNDYTLRHRILSCDKDPGWSVDGLINHR